LLLKLGDGQEQLRNIFQQTPFQVAYEEGYNEICELLRQKCDENIEDTESFLSFAQVSD